MNKLIRAILVFTLLVVCLVSAYEFLCIHELTANVARLSNDIRELDKDSRSSHRDIQEMKYEIKVTKTSVDLILDHLQLIRPYIPNDGPIPILKEE